jgi:anti-sigma-K factor RskA
MKSQAFFLQKIRSNHSNSVFTCGVWRCCSFWLFVFVVIVVVIVVVVGLGTFQTTLKTLQVV